MTTSRFPEGAIADETPKYLLVCVLFTSRVSIATNAKTFLYKRERLKSQFRSVAQDRVDSRKVKILFGLILNGYVFFTFRICMSTNLRHHDGLRVLIQTRRDCLYDPIGRAPKTVTLSGSLLGTSKSHSLLIYRISISTRIDFASIAAPDTPHKSANDGVRPATPRIGINFAARH